MLDYSLEAARYDETRGGLPRARAAAEAVRGLIPEPGTLLDLACGTGLVTRELAARGLRVLGVDAAAGMARLASERVPVVLGDGRRLPVRDRCVDAVTTFWLLHLLDDARPVIAEAARVLRPGGVFVTTVDKKAAHRPGDRSPATDGAEIVIAEAARRGLRLRGEPGTGRGVRGVPTRFSGCWPSPRSEPGFAS
ncbi:class I SAM-dependent methyltransferase [Nonomuraea sp. FMUSA5-5]|uniref:Class I SAM-dependent methyltransferase n=1 Tax=Nonomuraea composti TaxID=2720023 RepID=A0ABX1B1Y4_9ACTN|nr:class I SAM-dependent methyltransferase [Nonomuraea sp. FMUSA5-5]